MTEAINGRKVWYLRHIDLFASMTDEEIEEIARLLGDHHIPAGVPLLDHRDRDRVYLIKDGAVRLHTGDSRHQVTLALLPPGRMFGLSSTIGDDNPRIDATTLVPSYVCVATWSKMIEVFARYPEVMLQLLRSLTEQVFRTETWRTRLGMTSPAARLADLLLELSEEFGEPTSDGRRIRFRLTQADLAQMIGLSRETISRLMTEFSRCGWVTRERGLVIVRDRGALMNQGGGGERIRPAETNGSI